MDSKFPADPLVPEEICRWFPGDLTVPGRSDQFPPRSDRFPGRSDWVRSPRELVSSGLRTDQISWELAKSPGNQRQISVESTDAKV